MHEHEGAAWEAIPPAPQAEPGLVGNRPANRARQATPGVLSQGWQGREGAVDFLGLDQELGASPAPYAAAPIPEAPPGEGSWLLDGAEDSSASEIELPAMEQEADEAGAEEELDDFVPAPPIQASWVEPTHESGKRKVALRAAAVLALGAVGFTAWQVLGSGGADSARTPLAPEVNLTPRYQPVLALKSAADDSPARERMTASSGVDRLAPQPEVETTRTREPVGAPLAQGPAPVWVDTERLEPPPEADVLREAFGGGETGMLPPEPAEPALKVLDWGDSSSALERPSEPASAVAGAQDELAVAKELGDAIASGDVLPGGASVKEPVSESVVAEAGGGSALAQAQPSEPEVATGSEPEVTAASEAEVATASEAEVATAIEPAPSASVAAVEPQPASQGKAGEGIDSAERPMPAPPAVVAGDSDGGALAQGGSKETSLRGLEALSAIRIGPMPAPSSAQPEGGSSGTAASGFEQLLSVVGNRPGGALESPPPVEGLVGPAAPPSASGTEASREPEQAPSVLARVGRAERTSRLSTEDVLAPTATGVSLQLASQQDLSSVWTRGAIPFDAIGSPTKVLTPMVGRVRLVLKTKEIFEGRLYAVGENHVWIDTQYGRMGLPGARVDRIEPIEGGPGTPALGAPGSQALVGLERVRVKTPGGVFYGKVISKDETKTTLVTDQGARITLDSKDVEYLSDVPKVTLKTDGK